MLRPSTQKLKEIAGAVGLESKDLLVDPEKADMLVRLWERAYRWPGTLSERLLGSLPDDEIDHLEHAARELVVDDDFTPQARELIDPKGNDSIIRVFAPIQRARKAEGKALAHICEAIKDDDSGIADDDPERRSGISEVRFLIPDNDSARSAVQRIVDGFFESYSLKNPPIMKCKRRPRGQPLLETVVVCSPRAIVVAGTLNDLLEEGIRRIAVLDDPDRVSERVQVFDEWWSEAKDGETLSPTAG